jgi:SAM-dependent methyltransferase
MTLPGRIRDFLTEPLVRNTDPDSSASTFAHREIVRRKVLLRALFERFYRDCRSLDSKYFAASQGVRFEIGSGSSFFKEVFPDILTSDVKTLPFIDLVASADALPMRSESVRAVYAINVFHHLPDPRLFFRELDRVLAPGGGTVLIEPYHGPVARVIFRHLHATESFDTTSSSWRRSDGGPMSNANQALSYLVFERDRKDFEREFPRLELVHQRPHTHLMYVLSGGVNFRQLVPDSFAPGLLAVERVLSPLDRILALQQTLVLRKKL